MTTKYKSVPITVDGERFASQGEYKRWCGLCLLQRSGTISDLRRQVPYKIAINGKKVCTYRADFVYNENGASVVEDFKGFPTPLYKLKRKLVEAFYNITIKESR